MYYIDDYVYLHLSNAPGVIISYNKNELSAKLISNNMKMYK